MTGALERVLSAMSPSDRRVFIRLAREVDVSPLLKNVLMGVAAELLSDMARASELLSALDAEMAADRQALDDRPYPPAAGPALWLDPVTGNVSTEPPTQT
jgi:hypothetical protein